MLRWIGRGLLGLSHENHVPRALPRCTRTTTRPRSSSGDIVSVEREDDSDARLTWLGARATGIFDLGARGIPRLLAGRGPGARGASARSTSRSRRAERVEVEDVDAARRERLGGRRRARAGCCPLALRAARLRRLRAVGSARSSVRRASRRTRPASGASSASTATACCSSPELSNLGIVTVGAGLSLFRSSSLDLVYHHYRLDEPERGPARFAARVRARRRARGARPRDRPRARARGVGAARVHHRRLRAAHQQRLRRVDATRRPEPGRRDRRARVGGRRLPRRCVTGF